jgi:putative solute:sodium symporter small subunit
MEPSDQYNFSIFKPRNLHGKKNRNIILTILLIWATTVFGFQLLLRVVQKPTPEKTLEKFESVWPAVLSGIPGEGDRETLLHSIILVKGKNIVKPEDQKVLSDAINTLFYMGVPDSIKPRIIMQTAGLNELKRRLPGLKDQEYLDVSAQIGEEAGSLGKTVSSFVGFQQGGNEAVILVNSLQDTTDESLSESARSRLPEIMQFYLTHNQSKLTDTKFLGFPFHYFYTAVFLLILFIALCIIYNKMIERRLEKEGIVE